MCSSDLGEQTLPAPAEMERVTCLNRVSYLEQFEHNAHRVRSLVDYYHYMDDIADLIGCRPPLWKYFFLHPWIWLRIVCSATQATQFRLQGFGSKESLASELLMKLPLGVPLPVMKVALKNALAKRLTCDTPIG